jgi:hypothetical protein
MAAFSFSPLQPPSASTLPVTIGSAALSTFNRRKISPVKMSPRRRKAVAVLCIALVVCAAFVPAIATSLGTAILVPLWLVMPAVAIAIVRRNAFRCDEQPVSLLAILSSRGPPTLALLA